MYDIIPAHFAHAVSGYEPDGYLSGDDWIDELP
jgi:streptomycin 6-kinase